MTIWIIGLGGIGSPLSLYLGRTYPESSFVLIDNDIWDDGNAARCPLTRVGWAKADCAALALTKMGVNAMGIMAKYPGNLELVPIDMLRPDMIVACTDNLSSRRAAFHQCCESGAMFVYAGNTAHVADAWVYRHVDDGSTPRCPTTWFAGWEDPDEVKAPSCTAHKVVEQTATCNLVAAATALWLIEMNVKYRTKAPWRVTTDGGNGIKTHWRD